VVTVNPDGGASSASAGAREQLQRRLVQARYHEATGEPASQLVRTAHELDADLIVIGRGNGRPALGSVSSKVVGRAGCDVLVVR
jgi:nucleotide-binding universal stress UspA family protein